MNTSSSASLGSAGLLSPIQSLRIRQTAPVLYTLLDAADEAGLLRGDTRAAWHSSAVRLRTGGSFDHEASTLHDVMLRLAQEGIIANTWIAERWRAISSQIARPLS